MKYFKYFIILLGLVLASVASANEAIMKAAEAKALAEHLEIKYSCLTCHRELPSRRNDRRLNLTEEGKKWRLKKKPTCAVQ